MSLWGVIVSKIKEILQKMIGARTIEHTLHVTPVISSKMEEAIQLWTDMYKGEAPWLREPTYENPVRVASLGLPALIASEKARMALLEFQSEITTPTEEQQVKNPDFIPSKTDEFGNIIPTFDQEYITQDVPISDTQRAEFLNTQYEKLKKQLRKQIEYGVAKGGLVIKPYVVFNDADDENSDFTADIEYDFIQADAFYPLAFDASGKITEAAFIQTKAEKDVIYRRLEYHKWSGNKVEIVNKAFKSTNNTNQGDMSGVDLGQEIQLNEIPEWKDLQDRTVIKNVTRPLFAYFKMPEANTVDTTSPLGVACYSRAVSLIKDADMQYSRLLWEYEGGEMAIDIDRDALNFKTDPNGNECAVPNSMQARLYRKIDLGDSDTYQPYAPTLRDSSFTQGLNTILMRIEDTCGISRGTLSDASTEAKTATELKILKQRSYQTNADIQRAIEDTLRDVIYIMDVYATLYTITTEGEYDVSFEWDDSIIVDVDEELNKRITLMQNGLASKLENRMWYFGETERQAQEALQKIDQESMQAMQQDLAVEANRMNMVAKNDEQRIKAQAQQKK